MNAQTYNSQFALQSLQQKWGKSIGQQNVYDSESEVGDPESDAEPIVENRNLLNLQSEEQNKHAAGARQSGRMYWGDSRKNRGISKTGYERFESCAQMTERTVKIQTYESSGQGFELQCLSTMKGMASKNKMIQSYVTHEFEHRFDNDLPKKVLLRDMESTEEILEIVLPVDDNTMVLPIESDEAKLKSSALSLRTEKFGNLRTIAKPNSNPLNAGPPLVGRQFFSRP